jgi:hypothetical protein
MTVRGDSLLARFRWLRAVRANPVRERQTPTCSGVHRFRPPVLHRHASPLAAEEGSCLRGLSDLLVTVNAMVEVSTLKRNAYRAVCVTWQALKCGSMSLPDDIIWSRVRFVV